MNKQRKLKKELKGQYRFRQNFQPATVQELISNLIPRSSVVEVATLEAGLVRLEAVIFWERGRNRLGYDLLVRDSVDAPDWICYESLPDEVRCISRNLEREMFHVMDRAVEQFGLSYIECHFPKLDGKLPEPK